MAGVDTLRELRAKELITLKERVRRRVKLKPGSKRIRRITGVDIVLTPRARKVHVCACVMSFPKLRVLEETIATDELDAVLQKQLGVVVFVPLILSVLKMLKSKTDVVMIREIALKEELPLASYVGVISGRPAIGVSDRSTSPKHMAKWDGVRRAGTVRIRGHKTPVGVIAGHLMTFKDASSLVKACATEVRMPEPLRNAGMRVRAWEREWRRVNLERG